MPNVALIAVNAKYSHSNLALLYLKAAMKDAALIEWDINRPMRELMEKLAGSGCGCFMFSVYIWNAEWLKRFIPDLVKIIPDAIVCIGGPEAVYNFDEWKTVLGISYILDGNAEDFSELPKGLVRLPEARLLKLPERPFEETPFPYDEALLGALKGRIIYYEASRGCLFNCSYCLSAAKSGKPDYRRVDQVRREIKLLSRFEGTVKFVDRTFNADKKVSRGIWRMMTESPPSGCFHFEIHPLLLEDEDFYLLERLPAGSAQLEIGIQSTDSGILGNVNRVGNWERTRSNIERLSAIAGLNIHLDQIVGLPGDTPEAAAKTMDDIMSLKPDMFQLGFLKVLSGTPLNAARDRFGLVSSSSPPYELLKSGSFSFERLQYFHRIEKLIDILYNSGFFRKTLSFLVEVCGSWFGLFCLILAKAEATGEPGLDCRRWELWGRLLYELVPEIAPSDADFVRDLLRLDWCPFAGAQRYPDFLQYSDSKKMNELKRLACRKALSEYPYLEKSRLKRAILFVPECLSPDRLPFSGAVLFVRHGYRLLEISSRMDIK